MRCDCFGQAVLVCVWIRHRTSRRARAPGARCFSSQTTSRSTFPPATPWSCWPAKRYGCGRQPEVSAGTPTPPSAFVVFIVLALCSYLVCRYPIGRNLHGFGRSQKKKNSCLCFIFCPLWLAHAPPAPSPSMDAHGDPNNPPGSRNGRVAAAGTNQ